MKDESIELAIEKFKQLVNTTDSEEDVEWVFKSFKQLAKVTFYRLEYQETLFFIGKLIAMLPKLNGNYAEESINKLLSRFMHCANREFVSEMYDVIVNQLQDSMVSGASGHRLWLRININRFKNLLEDKNLESAHELLTQIKKQLGKVTELTRNSFALDVIAAEIELSMFRSATLSELIEYHRRSTQITSAITHPRVMGVIKECGATVHFFRKQFERARLEFYESFKNYDEAGSSSKRKILKYLGLCSMLTDSELNPFESQETQSYVQLPEYQNLIALIDAYESRNLNQFRAIADRMRAVNDPLSQDRLFLVAEEQISHNLKLKVLSKYLRASKTISYDFLMRKLCLKNDEELEYLILTMANNGLISMINIDYENRLIEIHDNDQLLFHFNMDGSHVKNNVDILYNLRYSGPHEIYENTGDLAQMEMDSILSISNSETFDVEPIDNLIAKTNIHELLFCESPYKRGTNDIEQWYKFVVSALPPKKSSDFHCKNAPESKTISTEHNLDDEDEGAKNTDSGILGSSINYSEDLHEHMERPQVDKIDSLLELARSMKRNLRSGPVGPLKP